MIRLLGIVLGSVVAIAFLVVIAGVPRVSEPESVEDIVVEPEMLNSPVATVEPELLHSAVDPVEPEPMGAVAELPQQAAAEPYLPPAGEATRSVADERQWFAFWSPFRTRIAANGFVEQLQRVTGLDYRVVSVKPAVFEVAFAYVDDAEIQVNLAQISAETGLEVPGS